MKAIRIHAYGETDVLVPEDAPMPDIGADGVLIRVSGIGINPVDWKIRKGLMQAARPLRFPAILGQDVSGHVERVGPLVARFKPGDRVVATRVPGAYAEYAAAVSDRVAPAPESIPLTHAAGLPVGAGTAWQVLFDAGQLRAGQRVLIHAAAGGVGAFAVQLAHLAGAHVIATASGGNVDLVRSLGADEVIDYRGTDFAKAARDVDLVFDTVGGETQTRSFGVIRQGGRLITIASPPDMEAAKAHGVTASFERLDLNGARLGEIAGLVDRGKLRVLVDRELPLSQAVEAHRMSETGHTRGKIILTTGV